MKRSIASVAALVLGSVVLVGCDGSTVKPNGSSENIAAYAAKVDYPTSMQAMDKPTLFYMADDDGTITLGNSGNEEMDDLKVFVNKNYVIHVMKLMPRSTVKITPDTLFDKVGNKLADADNKSVTSVEVQSGAGLMKAMGPVKPQTM